MKIKRVVELNLTEQAHLDYLQAVANAERTLRSLRRRAIKHAVEMKLPTRLVGQYAGMSAAEVSRTSTGLRP